ncbi:MAG: alpha/beta fold hydrolase [Proteobacteria bacterium]|nr:alpha/beta fold hydrolase [Pseudomonadota bacterium]MBU1714687.1 alpha/beta fold hydrolase [Pseudomonadota bacterium]
MREMIEPSAATVFCLPFAGGSSHSYQELQRFTNSGVKLVGLDLPGRGSRFSEPLLKNLPAVVDDLFSQIKGRLSENYAIYGHSLGACLGYLLVKRIIREQCPLPFHLFVSGREAPSSPKKAENRHLLPRADFFDAVRQFEGTTNEVLENRELMDLFEPVLRADFQALDTYIYEKDLPFDVPITVMHGTDDHVTISDAQRWQEETTREISLLEFQGGHFFIFKNAKKIVEVFAQSAQSSFELAV